MKKLKIRITEFDPQDKLGRFFIDKEQTVFLDVFEEDTLYLIINSLGMIKKGFTLSTAEELSKTLEQSAESLGLISVPKKQD